MNQKTGYFTVIIYLTSDRLPFGWFYEKLEWVKSEHSTCWQWHWCCHHPAHHLGGVWTPPPTLHTHSTWARWSKPWLPTLVEYHSANSGSGVVHNHLTSCIVGISTVNSTSCMGTTNKCLRHFRKDGYFVITNDLWKCLRRTNLSISPIIKYWGTDKVFSLM